MSEIIATLFTADARAVEVIARPGEIEVAFLGATGRVDRLFFAPEQCEHLEAALKNARLIVSRAEGEPA